MSNKSKSKTKSGAMLRIGGSRVAVGDEYLKMINSIGDHFNLENPSQIVKFLIKKEYKELSTDGR